MSAATMTRGERIQREAWERGDERRRCDQEGHLECEWCGDCACIPVALLDSTSFPNRRLKVTTDKQGRTMCRECRYVEDQG